MNNTFKYVNEDVSGTEGEESDYDPSEFIRGYHESPRSPRLIDYEMGRGLMGNFKGLGINKVRQSNEYDNDTDYSSRKSSKIINDVIHGHMEVPDYIMDFIDTEQFQRLRDLKQVGTTSFVFPCASHSRFEHSIGVSHLAGKYIDRIKVTQPELEITEREQKFVRIAGLCHDLGHGPFSHAFESWVDQLGGSKRFHHEDMSIKMLNWIIDDHGLDEYDSDDIKFISSLIQGKHRPKERAFIYDIVANNRNSVDVDKFDYLSRDSYYLGRSTVCDFQRLMEFSKVIDDQICFLSKEIYNLYELFHTRYSLHKLVYTHKVGKSIEFMIADAFTEADQFLKISDQLEDPKEFINLSDSLLRRIETSKEPELEKSRKIIKNIRNRNLYKFVDEIIVSTDKIRWSADSLAEDIAKVGNGILESDIIVQNLKLNYAFKDKDPVQSTRFYTRYDSTQSFTIKKEETSHLIPNQFQEERIRIFCRSKEKCEQVQTAFRKLLKNHNLSPNPSFTVSPARNIKKI
ncbi:HD phosphohydrolase domain-containing protein [Dictyostelium discoideum AX4]|uniref:Deoxynucleoside triphosphate triphosphohydrolase SAMHD1 homolog n=1 Tax=Dictyostelium discoideum TaxID=44689 RepID=SAMH1_DICDI|nr:HD phosphohydrolase domain-containing protein [Dictyostelium discoideum AX4]B0G107.1 RecName: Full=Deoxynucleoside triphosphate triphosphohydrolase SAMHD1 homolog; Short=dNTPase [Dictyostelium discoideum]EDR41102.1 HD phosphohydrolase domain-containing protein [Dictyostelium discoideum AX4]|eukprot:XP_001732970.1 HD phosphohydrolase domain-containing protein [Dictyostelium discoideum AX4]